jgi:hypothetical protein
LGEIFCKNKTRIAAGFVFFARSTEVATGSTGNLPVPSGYQPDGM